MARLYIFAIGGTGARALRSFTHVVAAGTPVLDEHGRPMEVVPLVIDPDRENGDTLECLATLADYLKVQAQLPPGTGRDYPRGFFQTTISGYAQLQAATPLTRPDGRPMPAALDAESFRCGFIDAVKTKTFGEVIAYDFLESELEHGEPTRLLVDALYSRGNLETRLTGGFLGNPNVGTIVLNQIRYSRELQLLTSLLLPGDRIFIISSIFGGTGAAGFPVLVKLLRQGLNANGEEATALRHATIGALTVLPYFGLDDAPGGPVDANAFIPKTKAALAYYAHHLHQVNALYYLGDPPRQRYANTPTGIKQRNPDHVVELIAATAILHFAAQPAEKLLASSPVYHECGVRLEPSMPLTLRALGPIAEPIEQPLTQLAMARLFLREMNTPADKRLLLAQPWAREGEFQASFFEAQSPAFGPLLSFLDRWWTSLSRMSDNEPKLHLFGDSFANLRRDIGPNRRFDADDLNKALNQLAEDRCGPKHSLRRLLTLLWNGTADVYQQRYEGQTVAAGRSR
jgi:hypothetical protein